ncbi:Hypothetical protein ABZS17H1_01684 [Kosakonia cowanii]
MKLLSPAQKSSLEARFHTFDEKQQSGKKGCEAAQRTTALHNN